MNLCDCYVTRVTSSGYTRYGKWWVDVEFESWGGRGQSSLMFDTPFETDAVVEGFHFLA